MRVCDAPTRADESAAIDLVPESQHLPGQELMERKKYKITFGQIYLSKPMMTESDGETTTLFPHEARLRNLTCVPGSGAAPPQLEAARERVPTLTERTHAPRVRCSRPRLRALELTACVATPQLLGPAVRGYDQGCDDHGRIRC